MTQNKPETSIPTSTQLAADPALLPVWNPDVSFPSPQEMCDLDIVTHVSIERAKPGGYHYLHEVAITWYRDRFYLGWTNHLTKESGNYNELIRGCTSSDALHWSKPSIWIQPPMPGVTTQNNPIMLEHDGKLYGFFVCWREGHHPTTEVFILNDSTGMWEWQNKSVTPEFMPYCTPQLMDDGNWIMGGEDYWYEAAVAISDGDDLTRWKVVKIPGSDDLKLLYPECAVVNRGNGNLLTICRPNKGMTTAPISESYDYGKTWSSLGMSNFPLAPSQPFAGRLSTGQNYLLTNSLEDGRALLTIAVTGFEGGLFKRIFKLRHQEWPARRLFCFHNDSYVGKPTEWSYPNAVEHDGKLYIAYTQGKEDCVLSIVPIEVLIV